VRRHERPGGNGRGRRRGRGGAFLQWVVSPHAAAEQQTHRKGDTRWGRAHSGQQCRPSGGVSALPAGEATVPAWTPMTRQEETRGPNWEGDKPGQESGCPAEDPDFLARQSARP
jgi:hypothetical protein